ncbi:conserved Plasmodium membrane protein, unknown function [Plasmodium ovale curtisi]|uniref:Uncharacterized protein n=1 Tax=Plasmodium ovale curtisi TaxID=864141 RepID=A0A1A8WZD8_PLAOA|nr:conserved Plasmodium membrane protein, unknown function [Plasmodium ovale curtisi]
MAEGNSSTNPLLNHTVSTILEGLLNGSDPTLATPHSPFQTDISTSMSTQNVSALNETLNSTLGSITSLGNTSDLLTGIVGAVTESTNNPISSTSMTSFLGDALNSTVSGALNVTTGNVTNAVANSTGGGSDGGLGKSFAELLIGIWSTLQEMLSDSTSNTTDSFVRTTRTAVTTPTIITQTSLLNTANSFEITESPYFNTTGNSTVSHETANGISGMEREEIKQWFCGDSKEDKELLELKKMLFQLREDFDYHNEKEEKSRKKRRNKNCEVKFLCEEQNEQNRQKENELRHEHDGENDGGKNDGKGEDKCAIGDGRNGDGGNGDGRNGDDGNGDGRNGDSGNGDGRNGDDGNEDGGNGDGGNGDDGNGDGDRGGNRIEEDNKDVDRNSDSDSTNNESESTISDGSSIETAVKCF